MTDGDLAFTAAAAVLTLASLYVLHPGLVAGVFDPAAAALLGRRPAVHDAALALLLALATLVAVRALGSLLVVAMLVGPAASARLVCQRVRAMMAASLAFAAAAAVSGLYLSYHARTGASASVTVAVAALYVLTLGARVLVARVRPARRELAAGSAA